MDDGDDGTDDQSGFESAQAEKEAMYPESGFVLVEIDMLKPPGKALTRLDHSVLLSELTVPPATEMTDYVVYDATGNSYGHTSLEEMRDRVDAQALDELLDDLESESIRERRLALFGLDELADESPDTCAEAVPALQSGLDADKVDIRAATLDILATLSTESPEQVLPVTDEVLSVLDPGTDPRLRGDAIRIVAAIADHEPNVVMDAAPALTASLQEDGPAETMTITALHRIARAYPDAVVPAASDLIEYISATDASERVGAIAVLGAIAKAYPNVAESTLPVVSDLLDADSDRLRANAAGLIADLAEEYPEQVRSVVPQAIDLLNDTDEKARYNATSILARVAKADPEAAAPAVDPLIAVLDDGLAQSRANACWALGYMRADSALESLEELAEIDPNDEVQTAAEFAVGAIQDAGHT